MKPRLAVAGAGQTGLALATRTLSQWKPVLIEIDPEQALLAKQLEGAEVHLGDATSNLVLKRAGLEGLG